MKIITYNDLIHNCGDPIVVISHPRSGTHLTIDLLRKQFLECSSYKFPFESQQHLYLAIEGFLDQNKRTRVNEKRAYNIVRRSVRPIIKLHTYSWDILHEKFPVWMKWIDDRGQIIYVYRDVKSVLTSFYSYAKTFGPEAKAPISEFIRQSFCGRKNRPAYWQEMQDLWNKKKEILRLDFDIIINETESELTKIGRYLNLNPTMKQPLLPKKVLSLTNYRLHRLFSFRPESTAILGVYNKDSLRWQSVFNENDLHFIEEEISQ